MSPPKPKYPAALAKEVAREMVEALKPAALAPWLRVAGSLRREREEVGDVEIVYVPAMGLVQDGLFQTEGNLANEVLDNLVLSGVLEMRHSARGATMWGAQNKLARHVASGVPVDFFAISRPCFWSYLVCRTGSKEMNIALAQSAQERGLQWHPYKGFEVRDFARASAALKGHATATLTHCGQLIFPTSEQDVFILAGLPYAEPRDR